MSAYRKERKRRENHIRLHQFPSDSPDTLRSLFSPFSVFSQKLKPWRTRNCFCFMSVVWGRVLQRGLLLTARADSRERFFHTQIMYYLCPFKEGKSWVLLQLCY